MRRCAHESRYGRGSLAALISSRVASRQPSQYIMPVIRCGERGVVRTFWRAVEADSMLDRFGDGHDGVLLCRGNSMAHVERAEEGLDGRKLSASEVRFTVGREAAIPEGLAAGTNAKKRDQRRAHASNR
jgi:hypothetical protein